ncbi:hypothetical protein BGZ98_006216, partial [Dissophora globulifera]
NKLVKSFMDDFLIGESLEKYTTLREFQLLTCMEKNAFLDLEAEVDDDDYEGKSDDYEMLEHQSSPLTTAAANFPKPPAPAFSFGGFGASASGSAFAAPASTSLFGSAAAPANSIAGGLFSARHAPPTPPPPTGAGLFGGPPPPPIGLVTTAITRPLPMPTPAPPPPAGSMFNQDRRFMDTRSDTDSMEARQRAQQQLEQLQQFKP